VLVGQDLRQLLDPGVDRSLNLKRTLDRTLREDSDQLSKAAAAVRTASSTSRMFASSTCACCSPVAGFQTGA
jgi:hypothetical protein